MGVHEVYSSPMVVRLTGITMRQLDLWFHAGVVIPSVAIGEGRNSDCKNHKWSTQDVIVIRAMMRLRKLGIPPRELKNVAAYLQKLDPPQTFASVKLICDGKRLYHCMSDSDVVSLTVDPGQMVFAIWVVDLGVVEREVQQLLEAA